ncbi:MAG: phage tail protein, partial [Clostridiales bacterium]|nr:phage tail protein [Clostridiales bacterium]
MLKYYDLNKTLIGGLKNCKDLKVESELSTGDKQLSFLWHINNKIKMCLECYIRTDTDEFVIKENSKGNNGYRKIVANLNLEDLEGKAMEKFEAVEHTVKECADMALSGTGWRCICDMEKRRGMKLTKVTALDVLNTICKAFLTEVRFDTINKIVYFREEIGEDRGVYFAKSLNLKEVTDSADTYDYFTQILPIGKDGLKIDGINGGKAYLENYQYSSKKKMLIWEDSRYETAEALKEDAQKKLAEISKSKKSYQSKVIDLSKQNEKYSILSYSLGDTVTLIENETDLFEKQRIVKITEYLNDPTKNTCELSNTTLTFEEMQSRLFEAADIVNNITEDNGTVKVYATDIKGLEDYLNGNQQIKDLTTQYLYVSGELGALKASFGEMQTTYLKATDAEITYLKVEKAEADYLKIDVAEANYIKTNVFEALDATVKKINGDFLTFKSGEFETLKAKQASFEEATAQKFTAANGNIDNLTGQFATFKELTTTNFTAVTGSIKDLEVETQRVKTLLAGNITADNIATGAITAGSGVIAQGAIGDAEISNLSANKIKSGTVDTSLVTIASKDSAITINGNQLMVNDTTNAANPINRVILGKYT